MASLQTSSIQPLYCSNTIVNEQIITIYFDNILTAIKNSLTFIYESRRKIGRAPRSPKLISYIILHAIIFYLRTKLCLSRRDFKNRCPLKGIVSVIKL